MKSRLRYELKMWRQALRCLWRRAHLMVPGQRNVYCWQCFFRFDDHYDWSVTLRDWLGLLTWRDYPRDAR